MSQLSITKNEACPCVRCMTERNDEDGLQRFIVCAKCGNKRCPRSDWHGNECTNSNAPNQQGSRYQETRHGDSGLAEIPLSPGYRERVEMRDIDAD